MKNKKIYLIIIIAIILCAGIITVLLLTKNKEHYVVIPNSSYYRVTSYDEYKDLIDANFGSTYDDEVYNREVLSRSDFDNNDYIIVLIELYDDNATDYESSFVSSNYEIVNDELLVYLDLKIPCGGVFRKITALNIKIEKDDSITDVKTNYNNLNYCNPDYDY